MSLYNALFGRNPFSSILLEMLGTTAADVPRFRDCYLSEDGTEIVIHTRTGGGNREDYETENAALTDLPGYKYDEDDDFDCTYADFHYAVSEPFKAQLALLREMGAGQTPPAERWQKLFADLRSGEQTPETERAMKVGQAVFGQIEEWLKK